MRPRSFEAPIKHRSREATACLAFSWGLEGERQREGGWRADKGSWWYISVPRVEEVISSHLLQLSI